MSFKRNYNLIQHNRVAHEAMIKKFRCPECNNGFTNRSNLHHHCRKAHNKQLPARFECETFMVVNNGKTMVDQPQYETKH